MTRLSGMPASSWPITQRAIALLALMLLVALAVIGYAAIGKNAALVRNSLVAQSLPERAFAWPPEATPGDFKRETQAAPPWLREQFVAAADESERLTLVTIAVKALHRQRFVGKPIQRDLRTTWSLITERGRGYCADYSRMFTAMMLSTGIPVREWALGHKDFGSGHTFNEVWLQGKWVFVDAFNGMLVRDRDNAALLSVLEFRQRLEEGDFNSLEVIKLTSPDLFFQTREEGLNYYARSTEYFYLIWGNNVFSYENSPWVRSAAAVARPFERLVAIVAGEFPPIRLLETETNRAAIAEVIQLRRMLVGALVMELLLGAYLLWLLWNARRGTRTAMARLN